MWSKQADTRNTNKNMTSFKNKITHRKRKNQVVEGGVDSQETDLATKSKQAEEKQQQQQRQQKPGKSRGRNRGKKDASNAAETVAKSATIVKEPKSSGTNGDVTERDLESADVVLRHPNNDNNKRNTTNNSIKRYSDSFVIDKNDKSQIKLEEESDLVPPALTRAVSGFFIIDQARKARRFSDLFRPASNMKLSNSTECLKVNEKNSINKEKTSAKEDKKAKPVQRTNSNVKGDAKRQPASPKVETKSGSKKDNVHHDSYLKRVRSKIYKTKNENAASKGDEVDSASKSKKLKPKKSVDVTGRIPEDEVAVLTPNGLRKSLTHFDFRMTRQTSNLERVRPQTVGPDKSINISGDKPVLAKAKSSSAINLSLLRTRRNQIMEKVSSRLGAKDVQNEFDFIAFGSVNNVSSGLTAGDGLFGSQASLQKQPSWLHIHNEGKVEVKQGQPVSRSGSDRRPDAVREEGLKHVHQESAAGTESPHDVSLDKSEPTAMVSSTILPATGNQRRVNVNINRSESVKEQSEKRKQRRNISDPSHNTTSGDVDLDRHAALSNTDSGSSSNSSISCNGRLSESPSNSIDAVVQAAALRGTLDSDSDIDAESEQWQSFVPLEELRNLPPHEKKRQDVINELFHTESSHVRNLKVLYKIFYKKIHESQTLKPDELNLLFPNIKEILDLHTEFNKEMRRRRKEDPIVKELGHMLTSMFGDRCGESLKEAAATFCERQQLALEFIKKRRERDSKFNAVLTECEKKRQCRRLQLQGILPTEMQRLTKYPLLLERLMHTHESSDADQPLRQEELDRLKRAHQMSKEILNHVNEAAKEAHNKHRLEEIQKHLDTSAFERSDQHIAQEFKTIDLTKYRLIVEGGMQLKRPNKPALPVHILLLEEAVIILYREGERFILKFFQSGSPAQPQPLSPIIKMNVLLARQNASSSCELFLLDTLPTNSQKYDLVAEDQSKRDAWLKHFNDATDAYKKRQGGKSSDRKEEAASDSETESVQDLPPSEEVSERAAEVGGEEEENASSTPAADGAADSASAEDKRPDGDGVHEEGERDSLGPPEMVQTSWLGAEEWPLIQPSQVEVATAPVHTADTMLTSLEQIRRKDALVKQALEDKEGIVADMLSIPREHFQHIADMASMDTSTNNDISGQVLASIYQVHQLQKAVNESSNVTEMDAIAAKGGRFPSCASQVNGEGCSSAPLTVPASLVRDIAVSLNSQLTTLLSEVKQVEEERDRLRKEIHRMRERFHVEHNLHSPVPNDDVEDNLMPATDCATD